MSISPSLNTVATQYIVQLLSATDLSDARVTIVNPPVPAPFTSVELWHYMNALPPPAHFGALTDTNSFYDQYVAILDVLEPQVREYL